MRLLVFPFWLIYKLSYGIYIKFGLRSIKRKITALMKEHDCKGRMRWGMGLADMRDFGISIIFDKTADMNKFEKIYKIGELRSVVMSEIEKCGLGTNDWNTEFLSYHSHEAILESGGYYEYFK